MDIVRVITLLSFSIDLHSSSSLDLLLGFRILCSSSIRWVYNDDKYSIDIFKCRLSYGRCSFPHKWQRRLASPYLHVEMYSALLLWPFYDNKMFQPNNPFYHSQALSCQIDYSFTISYTFEEHTQISKTITIYCNSKNENHVLFA